MHKGGALGSGGAVFLHSHLLCRWEQNCGSVAPAEGTWDVQSRWRKAPVAVNPLCSGVRVRMPSPPQQGEIVRSRLTLVG